MGKKKIGIIFSKRFGLTFCNWLHHVLNISMTRETLLSILYNSHFAATIKVNNFTELNTYNIIAYLCITFYRLLPTIAFHRTFSWRLIEFEVEMTAVISFVIFILFWMILTFIQDTFLDRTDSDTLFLDNYIFPPLFCPSFLSHWELEKFELFSQFHKIFCFLQTHQIKYVVDMQK